MGNSGASPDQKGARRHLQELFFIFLSTGVQRQKLKRNQLISLHVFVKNEYCVYNECQ
jgi:hypothetical protein